MVPSDTAPDPQDGSPSSDDTRLAAVGTIDGALGQIRRSMVRRGLGRRVLDDLGLAIEPALVEVVDAVAEAAGAEEDGVAVGTVAARLSVDPSQASRLVADTVAAGLIARHASQRDGRRSLLRLTPSGEALIEATRRRKRALLLAHVEDWSDSELAEFARLLRRFSSIARG